MAVVEKVFVPLHCNIALIGSFDRHIEESAFRLFLLRKLDTYKSNIGVRRKTLSWRVFVNNEIQPSGVVHSIPVLQGVQPYAADEKMLTPLFFGMAQTKSNNRTFGS